MITRELERSAFYRDRVPQLLKQAGVFAFVSLTWIFFRAGSLADATLILKRIGSAVWTDPQIPLLMVALVAVVWLYQFIYESRFRAVLRHGAVRVGLAAAMLIYVCLLSSGGKSFIYFQF